MWIHTQRPEKVAIMTLLTCVALLPSMLSEAQQPAPGSKPDLSRFYTQDDALRQTKIEIESLMGVYSLHWPQRDPEEVVKIKKRDIDVRVWVSIGSQSENDLSCKALHWLVLGRHQWAPGARGVFGKFPDLDSLSLTLIDVRLNREGDQGNKDTKTYMKLRVQRKSFNNIDLDLLQDALANKECTLFIRRNGMDYSFDRKYYNKYLQER